MSRLDETYIAHETIDELVVFGASLCREGRWEEGLAQLSQAAAMQKDTGKLPATYYSWVGYGLAVTKKSYEEGAKMCRYAIKQEFYNPEHYANLARVCVLAGKRRGAIKAVKKGLHIDADSTILQELETELGARKQPVLSFLHRSNPLNVMLGRLRHSLTGRSK